MIKTFIFCLKTLFYQFSTFYNNKKLKKQQNNNNLNYFNCQNSLKIIFILFIFNILLINCDNKNELILKTTNFNLNNDKLILEQGCVMRDICGVDGDLRQNCRYEGRPIPISLNVEKEYKDLCPQLFKDGNIATCCNHAQFEILRDKMSIPRMLLQRCPSCYSNFANFFCQFTCSPIQANFVKIIEMLNDSNAIYDDQGYISRVEYYVSSNYAQQLFDSCKNVRTTTGDFVLSILCGTSIDNCTPERLFKYIGTYNKAINIPFTINVIIKNNSLLSVGKYQKQRLIKPMDTKTFKCNQSSDLSNSPCSCVDCLSSCKSSEQFPYLFQESCKMATMDCSTAMCIMAVCILFGIVMLAVVLHYILRMYTSEDVDDIAVDVIPHKDSSKFFRIQLEDRIINLCAKYGHFVGSHPFIIFFIGLIPSLLASSGITFIRLTTDPVELWSSPGSDAREQREFFDNNFRPFYRTEQIIIVPKNQSFWLREDTANFLKTIKVGPVFRKDFLKASFNLYKQILELNITLNDEKEEFNNNNNNINLSDICFKPQWPKNPHCVVMSIFNYFQNDIDKLDLENDDTFNTFDYMDHLFDCIENPYQMSSKLKISCLGQFGGPVQPYVVLGDFETSGRFETARGLIITLLVNNYKNTKNDGSFNNKNLFALEWEHKFIKLLKTYKNDIFNVTFIAERSLEDEIARQSKSDALTVFLSYLFMFIYVAFALSYYSGFGKELFFPFIHSKFILGICGIIGCILSVSSSIGLFAFFKMSASLIILEVEPFLVLAVGVDNIFIFVHSYQQKANNIKQPLSERISIICANVMPSMLLSSLSEFLCFSLGALSSMPAVQMFSLYAAVAILFNFLLQITFFLSIFVWDIQRQESLRLEFCCCIKINNNNNSEIICQPKESRVEHLMRKFYAPILLNKYIRIFIIIFFALWLIISSAVMNRINAGLDQKMAVPEDSYVLSHFLNMEKYLAVGPPIYFVLRGEYDYHDYILRNLVCSSSGCSSNSLGAQIARAAKFPERSYIAHPAMNWVDDYLDWLKPIGLCCRKFNINDTYCPPNVNDTNICHHCTVSSLNGQPDPNRFYKFLPNFLAENPSNDCPKAGHPTHGFAVNLYNSTNKFKKIRVIASYFMTYHTKLSSSEDFIRAMESAQLISQNITKDINQIINKLNHKPIEVFPYSPFYVFYEQYKGIVKTAILQIILSIACIFCVNTILLGMDPWSAFIVVIVIALILLNMVGSMWWWSIDFNAISVVNLVMSVGISVEFCAHIVRAFTQSLKPTRLERAFDSLCSVGCSVLSGITMTKLGGIFILAFAHSKIFKIYYFRMYLSIVLIGAAHGLIFLPVLLSYCGPPINRRRLFLNNLKNNNIIKLPYGTRNYKNNEKGVCSSLLNNQNNLIL